MKVLKIFAIAALVLILTGVFTAVFIWQDIRQNQKNTPETPTLVAGQTSDIFIDAHTIVREEIYYTLSRRVISTAKLADAALYGKNLAQLNALGWDAFRNENGQIVLFKEVPSLSPADENKRHLKARLGKLAVFAGPSNAQGPLLEELTINPALLGPFWQEQLNRGGLDFATNEELLTALEGLDEYNEY